jgi:hypothetical protein
MDQIWTISFFAVLLIAWGVAGVHDRAEAKRRKNRDADKQQR